MRRDKLGKWQFELNNFERIEYMDGRRTFTFGIYKLTSIPPVGIIITKQNYKGFRLQVTYLIKRGWY